MSNLYSPIFVGPSPDWFSPEMLAHAAALIESFHSKTGRELVRKTLLQSDPQEAARKLFMLTDTVVVSHGTQSALPHGPILNYGNTAALGLWGATWEQLTTMPSKFTAEPMERDARAEFMRKVTENGLVDDYAGVRIALDGSRFRIIGASVWNVQVGGRYLGQAACFSKWTDLGDEPL